MFRMLLLLIGIFPLICFAQRTDLSAYKYIYIDPLYYQQIDNTYGISAAIGDAFISKGFLLTNRFNDDNVPADLKANPCLLLKATPVYDDSPIRGIRLKLDIKNCNNENVFSKEVSATAGFMIQEAFRKAIKKMTTEIRTISYVFNSQLSLRFYESKFAHYTLKNSGLTEDSIKAYLDNSTTDAVEGIYKSYRRANDHSLSYKFAVIKKQPGLYHAIMIESETPIWKPGEIKMIIENTAIHNVFSLQYFMQDKTKLETFASITRSSFKIELGNKKNNGENSVASFIKVYPFTVQDTVSTEILQTDYRMLVGTGSGFLVTESGLLATNNHVLEGGTYFTASNSFTGKSFELEVVLKDKINDLAILRIKNPDSVFGTLPYKLSTRPRNGESVFTIGYPLGEIMGQNQKISNGIINALSGYQDDSRQLQISAPIQPGNSGGPLFDMKGNLIGITTSILDPKVLNVQNVNYALKISLLQNLNGLLPDKEQARFENIEDGREFPLTELSEKYRSFVFKINCYK
jgi:S1-C subfamily serine protease